MNNTYSRGSEWRRWDLHIHAPTAARNNSFGSWDEYIDCLEAAPSEVVAIGITDYCSIDGYKRVLEYRRQGRLQNFALILPNVELRLAIPAKDGAGINAHLIFSPHDSNHITKIEGALTELFMPSSKQTFRCTRQGLIDLGRSTNHALNDDDLAYTAGNNQFKLELSCLRNLFQNPWIKSNCLVAFSNRDTDGASSLSSDGGFRAIRDEIYYLSNLIFSANPKDRQYFLGQGVDALDTLARRYGGPLPCIHGSDAHSNDTLFRPALNRYCWIKADPTFHGLKQIQYEPEERVCIGENPPLRHDDARVINSIQITHSSGWFDTTTIPLNRGLTAIIGEKGSGKSALAELIAYACNGWYADDGKSFLERARSHLDGLTLSLTWFDGSCQNSVLTSRLDRGSRSGEARYLSQRFVERLCSDDYTGDDLVNEIESVVFSHLEPSETLNASDFRELRALRTNRFSDERLAIAADIDQLIHELEVVRSNIISVPLKSTQIESLRKERDGLIQQLPHPQDDASAQLEANISQIQETVDDLQNVIGAEKQVLALVDSIRSRHDTFAKSMKRFFTEIRGSLREAGFSEEQVKLFEPRFVGDAASALAARERVLKARIEELEGSVDTPLSEQLGASDDHPSHATLRSLQKELASLRERRTEDLAIQDKRQRIQKRIAAIAQEEKRLKTEIERINDADVRRASEIRTELITSYVSFFLSYEREVEVLQNLYEPVSKRLADASGDEKHLEFFVRWNVDIKTWLERGGVIFDSRRKQPYGSVSDFEKHVINELLPNLLRGAKEDIIDFINKMLGTFLEHNDERPRFIKDSYSLGDLIRWLLDTDHISLKYGIKYNGVPLEDLSPGSKGIVLLVLYLDMDETDTRPIIIDQPEENLDNKSVYRMLTKYFRKAKNRRQIILITHNPNLVVSTDAEQVIVATAARGELNRPRISYNAGALEHSSQKPLGIRESVCNILEGGEDAFRKREKTYGLSG